MRIPASLHGPYRTCDAAARRAVARIARGAGLHEAFADGGWVDPADAPGLIVLEGPSPLLGGEPHFHVYLPLTAIVRAVAKKTFAPAATEAVFEQALAEPWSVLSLCAVGNQIWTAPEHRHGPFLRALVPCWDALVALGERYSNGSRAASALWPLAHPVRGVLVRRGIAADALIACPSAARLRELVDRAVPSA